MSTPPSSVIAITYDGVDITDNVLFSSAHFECQANAVPGTFSLTVKDSDRSLFFETGKEVYLYVDGIKMFGGICLRVGRKLAFPVDDTTTLSSVKTRQWVLEGADFNIWFDKRVIRNTADYKSAIILPALDFDGAIVRQYLPNYIDVPPGVDMTTYVEDVAPPPHESLGGTNEIGLMTQGTKWREQMDMLASYGSAVYYIDADKYLHFHALETASIPWSFVDHAPNGTTRIPCREVTATEDGSVLVTDALVWGGLEVEESIYFARYIDEPALAQHGRWQLAEQRFQEGNDQQSTEERARTIIMGPPGIGPDGQQAGLRFPLWRINLTWFGHEIPRVLGVPQYPRPGNLVNVILYVMGQSATQPLTQFLPLRNMTITFPQLAGDGHSWVKFDGELGLSYSDSRYLWKFILARQKANLQFSVASVGNFSASSSFGDWASMSPVETPDGSRTDFTFPFPFLPSTMRLYVNGLLWRPNKEYVVLNDGVTVRFYSPLAVTDQVHIETRTGQS